MQLVFTEINAESAEYPFVERLLHSAFPAQERRPDAAQRHNTLHERAFHTLLVSLDGQPAGMLTYWDFGTFRYGEHFAIADDMRCGGIGGRVLKAFIDSAPTPVVLEVEPAGSNDMAARRIAFYERHSLHLWADVPYLQPPYRQDGEWFPLRLMATQDLDPALAPDVIKTIHRHVYGAKAEN